jgi:hypothetical protein
MSSIQAKFKQIPVDSQYFVSLNGATGLNLSVFNVDAAASTTSYVSGAASGNFTTSNTGTLYAFDASGAAPTVLFRDMGVSIISSARSFRAVQLLKLDCTGLPATQTGAGSSGWTSTVSGTPGVWKPSNEGVVGSASPSSLVASSFGVFYFETGARGLGLAQGLVRYG